MTLKPFLICLTFSCTISAQTLNQLYQESQKAYTENDFPKFKALTQQALALHPSQPALLYNMAIAQDLNGEREDAIATLCRLLTWNAELPYKSDKDFQSLLQKEEVVLLLDSISRTHVQKRALGKVFLELPKGSHVEDLLMVRNGILFTDVLNGRILKYTGKYKGTRILAELPGAPLALAKRKNAKTVWVSVANLPEYHGKKTVDSAMVCEISLRTGKMLRCINLPPSTIIGAMAMAANGHLYATDSSSPNILVFDTESGGQMDSISVGGAFNLQGISLDQGENVLYIADYIKGIAKISLNQPQKVTWLASDQFLMKGIDGLSFVNDTTLMAIQNNSRPNRVIKIQHDHIQVKTVELLENGIFDKGEPTNGKWLDKKGFLYISNSPWSQYDENHMPKLEEWDRPAIRLVPLE